MESVETSTRHERKSMVRRRHFLTLIGGVAGSGLLAACGAGTPAPPTPTPAPIPPPPTTPPVPTAVSATAANASASSPSGTTSASGQATGQVLVIEAVEYGFKAMASVPGGQMTIQIRNLGREPHYAHLFHLNDGVTTERYMSALQQDLKARDSAASDALATQMGGPGTAIPGSTVAVIQDLRPGQYVIGCFVANDKGVPHAALGMVLPLMVTAPTGQATAAPAVNGVITLTDTGFDLPGAIPAGKSMYRVVNGGTKPHELSLLGLTPGKTVADLQRYFAAPPAGPPPLTSSAGIAGLDPGQSGIVILDLTPGAYAVLVGDPTKTEIRGITVG
jgi:hypothetical protein